ncbi:MAG: tetraacyldisaccharide 4'-kinase [Planctomycetota bacterium]
MNRFLEIVSGRNRGVLAAVARAGLRVLSWLFGALVMLRGQLYDRGILPSRSAPGPVLCVGNLTAGGTGKTPLVESVARHLMSAGHRVAILGRGYGASEAGQLNDELMLLRDNLAGAIVIADRDRERGAREAFEAGADVIVMDDGFQHRRLRRSLDIVAIDAANPFGFGHLLPRGLLREPASALRRAGAVVITRCDRGDASSLEKIERAVRTASGPIPIVRSEHRPVEIVAPSGEALPIASARGRRVFAFAGLANNEAFFETVREAGAELVGQRSFPDHHAYDGEEVWALVREAEALNADWILTTQKDAVKLRERSGSEAIYWLRITLCFIGEPTDLWKRIESVVGKGVSIS